MEKRASWASRGTFILAAVGSAVGLGNAWRFPGLVSKYGGGAFLFVYVIAMLIMGVPLLAMEISIGRKTRQGAPGAMRMMNKKVEWIGWTATTNAFVIATYYAVVFAWVLLMFGMSYKFAGMTGNSKAASELFANTIQTTWDVKGASIPPVLILVLVIGWALIYYCIRDGANSVGKVVKITVFAPVICLVIMAIKSMTLPGAMEGLAKLFIPEWAALQNPSLWVDACGQVFYSLSIMMAIMFAYGSFLDRTADVAADALIIAFSDLAVSVLSAVVMFTTMYGCGIQKQMSDSGIATAFIVYPMAIVKLTSSGVVNAIFGAIFYLCLITLAIDSAFSIVEGVSTAFADKFHWKHKQTTKVMCLIAAVCSIVYITRAGLAWLDIVDHWTNQYNMIIIGILECIAVGWRFKPQKVLDEVNKNAKKIRMPAWWFVSSIKFVSPLILAVLFIWNMVILFGKNGGHYSYALWAEIAGGWLISVLCFLSGPIIRIIIDMKKKKGFVENDKSWDDME